MEKVLVELNACQNQNEESMECYQCKTPSQKNESQNFFETQVI
jgi:hypothetical protein